MQSLSTWIRATQFLAAGAFAQVARAAFSDRTIRIVVPFAAGSPPGTWLYARGRPVLHEMEMPFEEGHGGAINHVAFEARGRAAIAARLDAVATFSGRGGAVSRASTLPACSGLTRPLGPARSSANSAATSTASSP